MKNIRLIMINEDLSRHSPIPLQPGFKFRFFQDGDQETWAEIEAQAQEFPNIEAARARFQQEFRKQRKELSKRCFFLLDPAGKPVGTAMGWYGSSQFEGLLYGRLHWIAIIPSYQSLGLGRPLISQAVEVLKQFHKKAFLVTRPRNYRAIRIYLDFGFKPHLTAKEQHRGWRQVEEILKTAILSAAPCSSREGGE
ncbi:MAG: GNAT family N-acetyltransferase [Firmicutes bacterium]|nr:GNAT family N-acetyltransferase [Bacillota bacterium]